MLSPASSVISSAAGLAGQVQEPLPGYLFRVAPLQGVLPQNIFDETLRFAHALESLNSDRIYKNFQDRLHTRLSGEGLEILAPLYEQVKGKLESAEDPARGSLTWLQGVLQGIIAAKPPETWPLAVRADREIVRAAVTHWGGALEYASEALRADREIVEIAVRQWGPALQHASEMLQADRKLVETSQGKRLPQARAAVVVGVTFAIAALVSLATGLLPLVLALAAAAALAFIIAAILALLH